MASTDKTPKLGLNQWAAGDNVLRADFNADNGKLDEVVGANVTAVAAAHALAAGKATMVTGEYKGDGLDNRKIVLGFCPKFLVLQGPYYGPTALLVVTRRKLLMIYDSNGIKMQTFTPGLNSSAYLDFSADGFQLGTGAHLNYLNYNYDYVAFV